MPRKNFGSQLAQALGGPGSNPRRSRKIPWRELPLFSSYQQSEISPESAAGIRALREYRSTGSMRNVFLATESEMERAEESGIETAAIGPEVQQINWRGFPRK